MNDNFFSLLIIIYIFTNNLQRCKMKSKKVSLNYNKKIAKQTKKLSGGRLFSDKKLANEKEYIKKLQDHIINYNIINNKFIKNILDFYNSNVNTSTNIADLIKEFNDKTQLLILRYNSDLKKFHGDTMDNDFQQQLDKLEKTYSSHLL